MPRPAFLGEPVLINTEFADEQDALSSGMVILRLEAAGLLMHNAHYAEGTAMFRWMKEELRSACRVCEAVRWAKGVV